MHTPGTKDNRNLGSMEHTSSRFVVIENNNGMHSKMSRTYHGMIGGAVGCIESALPWAIVGYMVLMFVAFLNDRFDIYYAIESLLLLILQTIGLGLLVGGLLGACVGLQAPTGPQAKGREAGKEIGAVVATASLQPVWVSATQVWAQVQQESTWWLWTKPKPKVQNRWERLVARTNGVFDGLRPDAVIGRILLWRRQRRTSKQNETWKSGNVVMRLSMALLAAMGIVHVSREEGRGPTTGGRSGGEDGHRRTAGGESTPSELRRKVRMVDGALPAGPLEAVSGGMMPTHGDLIRGIQTRSASLKEREAPAQPLPLPQPQPQPQDTTPLQAGK